MKFSTTVSKNLKLIMRAKSSALIVLLGPLMIILLVALALNNPTSYELSASFYTPDKSNALTESFVQELENNNYLVSEQDSEEECIETIKQGTVHMCIVFPKDFEIGNEDANKVVFYVDYSRSNLVYQIIETVSKEFEIRTTELSKDLTEVLLTKIDLTKKDVDKNILSIITIKSTIDSIVSDIDGAQKKSEGLDFSIETISLSTIRVKGGNIYDDAKDLYDAGLDAVDEGKSYAPNSTELAELEEEIEDTYNNTPVLYDDFLVLIENATDEMNLIKEKLDESADKNDEIISNLEDVETSLDSLKSDTDKVKANLENTYTNLESIDISSAENIVSPIRTEIKPIAAESNQLLFFFPYLIVLVIMFIGIMLSSTIIIMEKKSKASFRNFTTPTKDDFFVKTTFVTSFIILFIQILIILLLSYYFMKTDIITNAFVVSVVLLISITLFILIGMIIGYVSTTQEAATMLSIALGSIFLTLSNLILPIETMSETIKQFTRFNPYVVSSELLKKAMLFKVSFSDIAAEIMFLIGFTIVTLILVFLINKASRLKFVEKNPYRQKLGHIYVPEDSYLKIENHIIKHKRDLQTVLEELSDVEFEKHVKPKNKFADWVSFTLKDKKLAWKLRTKSKKRMLKIINKHINKIAKLEEEDERIEAEEKNNENKS